MKQLRLTQVQYPLPQGCLGELQERLACPSGFRVGFLVWTCIFSETKVWQGGEYILLIYQGWVQTIAFWEVSPSLLPIGSPSSSALA
jgi:hypothetical protein